LSRVFLYLLNQKKNKAFKKKTMAFVPPLESSPVDLYGIRGPSYAQPELALSFYAPPAVDPMNNFASASYQEAVQLNATSLLPASFTYGIPEAAISVGERNWYPFAPTRDGFNNYVMATGATRLRQLERSAMGRKNGYTELLRTQPPVPLTATQPWFMDSPWRTDLVAGIGCVPGLC
jgi:hypothetical protein